MRTVRITSRSTFEIQTDTGEAVVLNGFTGGLFLRDGGEFRQDSYSIEGTIKPSPAVDQFLFDCLGKEFSWKLDPKDGTSSTLNGRGFVRSTNRSRISMRGTGPIERTSY